MSSRQRLLQLARPTIENLEGMPATDEFRRKDDQAETLRMLRRWRPEPDDVRHAERFASEHLRCRHRTRSGEEHRLLHRPVTGELLETGSQCGLIRGVPMETSSDAAASAPAAGSVKPWSQVASRKVVAHVDESDRGRPETRLPEEGRVRSRAQI